MLFCPSCASFQDGTLFSTAPIIQASSCLSKQSLSLSLSLLLKCPVLYAKQCHMSRCQSLGLAPLVCLKGPCTCWPCQCPLAQKSRHHTVKEAEKLFSGKVFLSTETHHHQTLALESSSSAHVDSKLKYENTTWIIN